MHGFLNPSNTYTVRQLLDRLKAVYCGTIGYEYMHITNRAQCNWIRDRIETSVDVPLTREEKLQLLDRMCYAEVRACLEFGSAFVVWPTAHPSRCICFVSSRPLLYLDFGNVRRKQVDHDETVWIGRL